MSNNEDIANRAVALLERADELRAEAKALLEPLQKARGWRGTSDVLSSTMTFDLPSKSALPAVKTWRRAGLLKAARDLDGMNLSIEAVPQPRRARR